MSIQQVEHGIAIYKSGDWVKAASLLSNALSADANHFAGTFTLGLAYFKLGQLNHAQAAFKKALLLDSSSALGHYNLGLIYERTGETDKARDHFKVAYALDPRFKEAAQKASSLAANGQPSARSVFPADREHQPRHPEMYGNSVSEASPNEPLFAGYRRINSFPCLYLLSFSPLSGAIFVLGVFATGQGFPVAEVLVFTALCVGGFLILRFLLRALARRYRYEIYDDRIDIAAGILAREHESIFLFRIDDVKYKRGLCDLLVRNANLLIKHTGGDYRLRGFAKPSVMRKARIFLRDQALKTRINIKDRLTI